MTNTDKFAERMARSDEAFTKHVVEGRSLRDLAPEMGVSYETVRSDVAAFRQYLADGSQEDLAAKRAGRLEELRDLKANALYIYERYKDSKPLTAVGALNTAMSAFTHIRAIEGLDMPKESKVDGDITYRVTWGDEDDTDGGYGEQPAPGLQRLSTKR